MSGTNKKSALLDSNVIIYATKGILDLEQITKQYLTVQTSIICFTEVAGYAFDDQAQEVAVMHALDNLQILPLEMGVALHAIRYRKMRKIKLPDALILATARHAGSDLLTFNSKDFVGLDQEVNVVTPGDQQAWLL